MSEFGLGLGVADVKMVHYTRDGVVSAKLCWLGTHRGKLPFVIRKHHRKHINTRACSSAQMSMSYTSRHEQVAYTRLRL